MTDEEMAALIGENVRAARVAAGVTQAELAERTGIAPPNISRLENGVGLPSIATLKRVSDALKVPICRFLDPPPGADDPPKKAGRRPEKKRPRGKS